MPRVRLPDTLPVKEAVLGVLLAGSTVLAAVSPVLSGEAKPGIGIEENLGGKVPLDAAFTDSSGKTLTLGELVDRPVILALAYYGCTNVCTELLGSLAGVVGRTTSALGEDYRVVAVSFDPGDTPEDAARKKKNYLKAASLDNPSGKNWTFLTGTPASIDALTGAVGYRVTPDGEGFIHPTGLVVISGEGKITRYIRGSRFLPADMDMAVREARDGAVGPTIPKALKLCFTYDPDRGEYAFSFKKTGGVVVLASLGVFAVFVAVSRRKRGDGGGDR